MKLLKKPYDAMTKFTTKELVLVFLLLIVSGNPIVNTIPQSKFIEFFCLILFIGLKPFNNSTQSAISSSIPYLFTLTIIFYLQAILLDANAVLGPIRLFTKILMGASIMYYLKDKFTECLLFIVYITSIISFVFFLFDIILPSGIYNTSLGQYFKTEGLVSSLFFYTYLSPHEINFGRNAGMFWEGGAYAGILILTIALNGDKIFKKKNRHYLFVLIISLITTYSTTGYIGFFMFIVTRLLLSETKIVHKIFLVTFIFVASYLTFKQMGFLSDKVNNQMNKASQLNDKGYNNTRFGSMLMDLHYIRKNPIIGNGFKPQTRWSDHPHIIKIMETEDIGSGNGLTNYAASMGIPALILYFLLIFYRIKDIKHSIPLIITIISALFGEQWLNFALFLALPFLQYTKLGKKDYEIT